MDNKKETPEYMKQGSNVLVSFSGGKTSAYMSYLLKSNSKSNLVFVFANTGQENEETLVFVDKCDKEFGLNVVWVEAVVQADGVGTVHKIVDFDTASRHGEPFEDVIKKYGIPNKSYPHCTRELKAAPIHTYIKSVFDDKYFTAIGIRGDEYRRVHPIKGLNAVYPLADFYHVDKEKVNSFWDDQNFNLDLYDYQGNCKWCWKKSLRKHMQLIGDDISIFKFPNRMEKIYGKVRCRKGRRVFFRGNTSTEDLFRIKSRNNQLSIFDIDDGCSESCELYETK